MASVIRNIDAVVPLKLVHATTSKAARAEPVAGLYELGRVAHVRGLHALEEQMCRMTPQGYHGKGSPDRLDALVWALTGADPGAEPADPVAADADAGVGVGRCV